MRFVSIALAAVAGASMATAQNTTDANPPAFSYGTPSGTYPGVRSSKANGATNPSTPSLNTPINQTSMARLASINSVDDWCTFGPPGTGEMMGDIEGETVAWCTKARNNARVIPDGTVTSAHFIKTPLYVQLLALGDFTRIGVVPLDEGGELDPHGATGLGNPVGGNVTSNVSGKDVFYDEWMNYISYNQVCFRICTAASSKISAALECEHIYDVMGCNWVMPGDYTDNVFDSCDGDAAYPPGNYPQPDGSTSTFFQFYEGSYTGKDGQVTTYTNGASDQNTPQAAYSTPATSNCQPASSIANGLNVAAISASTSAATSATSAPSGVTTSRSSSHFHASSTSTSSSGNSGAAVHGASLNGASFVGPVVFAMLAMLAGAAIL
ncbi:hypothetical protein OC861_000547 [Tilletia horrida]|nr:hypothetical protein OC845_003612 [Tilletia horrida]KAK0569836.1 hypothetical protein OC861_000547 [Tilletia horrida]